jgi:hypothetical protein
LAGVAILAAAIAGAAAHADSREVIYPADASIANVRDFGAKGDGVTDDTQALLRACRANDGSQDTNNRIVYLPEGTYLVQNTIDFLRFMVLQGQNRDRTVIRLLDQCVGFEDPKLPRPLVATGRTVARSSELAGATPETSAGVMFAASLRDLTLDTGKGNPGAMGLDYLAHNQGIVENVVIRSGDGAGIVGVDLTRKWIGPVLFKNVTVEGFDSAIVVGNMHQSVTFEFITLRNQRKVGIQNRGNAIFIRGLSSTNKGPAIENAKDLWANDVSYTLLVDADLQGGTADTDAIVYTTNTPKDAKTGPSQLFLRNIRTGGYRAAVTGQTMATIEEWTSAPVLKAFPDSGGRSLGLPVRETPEYVDNDFANWANVMSFGANPMDKEDDTAAIQAAIDSGRTTVYLPPVAGGSYIVKDTLIVRGEVRRLACLRSQLYAPAGAWQASNKPVIRVEHTSGDAVFIEQLKVFPEDWNGSGMAFIEHASPRTLVIKGAMLSGLKMSGVRNTAGCGSLFIEDCAMPSLDILFPQQVWARQLNPEAFGPTHLVNRGGTVWVFGMKAENPSTDAATSAGGSTEILGLFTYDNRTPDEYKPGSFPRFLVEGRSRFSASYATISHTGAHVTPTLREMRAGETRELAKANVYPRGAEWLKWSDNVPLVTAYEP